MSYPFSRSSWFHDKERELLNLTPIQRVRKIEQFRSNQRLEWASQYRQEVCHNRRLKRAVLFAVRKIGKGIGGGKPFRVFSLKSKIKC